MSHLLSSNCGNKGVLKYKLNFSGKNSATLQLLHEDYWFIYTGCIHNFGWVLIFDAEKQALYEEQ